MDEVLEKLKLNGEEMQRKVGEYVKAAIDEERENDQRKNNLAIFNIKESEREVTEERCEDDRRECKNILRELKVEDCTMQQLIRLGKKKEDGKTRPLPVRMSSKGEK